MGLPKTPFLTLPDRRWIKGCGGKGGGFWRVEGSGVGGIQDGAPMLTVVDGLRFEISVDCS